MSTDTFQPPRFCPECQHKSGAGPCSTCKPYGAPCTWCIHAGPVPVDVSPEPFPLPIAVEPMQFSIANSDSVDSFGGATIGKYGAWNVCHDRTMIEISQGNGDPRIIWYGHGLGRHERSAIVPKLVAAIEGVIDATEGG